MFKSLSRRVYQVASLSSQMANLYQNLSLSLHFWKTKNLTKAHHTKQPHSPQPTAHTRKSHPAQSPRTPRILVMSLGRAGGCSQYTFKLLECFHIPYVLYQTKYAITEEWQENAIHITTYYHNRLSFMINTFCILPFYFLKILFQAKHYDVLLLPYFHFWNLAFIVAFRLRRKRVVLIEHDGVVHPGEGYPFQQSLVNLCLKYATEIIFLTHFVQSRISQHLIANKKVHIIPHGLYDFAGLETKTKPYSKHPTILFFGRVNFYKGIDLLLEALSTIPPHLYHLLIIAGKSSVHYDHSHIPKNKIKIIDKFLSQEEIAEVFNQSHILIMPYIEASQSGVASVGIANCIPTICTDVGGLKEQFRLDSNGELCALLCDPKPESIAKSLYTLLNDKTLYEKLSQNLSVRSKELSWDNIAKQIQNILISEGGGAYNRIFIFLYELEASLAAISAKVFLAPLDSSAPKPYTFSADCTAPQRLLRAA